LLKGWWGWFNLALVCTANRLPNLPSWVPDFHAIAAHVQNSFPIERFAPKYNPFHASLKERGIRLGDDVRELNMYGKGWDKVNNIYDPCLKIDDSSGKDYLRILKMVTSTTHWVETASSNLFVPESRRSLPQRERYHWLSDNQKVGAFWKVVLRIEGDQEWQVKAYRDFCTMLTEVREVVAKYVDFQR
jgi:hypothetical protein